MLPNMVHAMLWLAAASLALTLPLSEEVQSTYYEGVTQDPDQPLPELSDSLSLAYPIALLEYKVATEKLGDGYFSTSEEGPVGPLTVKAVLPQDTSPSGHQRRGLFDFLFGSDGALPNIPIVNDLGKNTGLEDALGNNKIVDAAVAALFPPRPNPTPTSALGSIPSLTTNNLGFVNDLLRGLTLGRCSGLSVGPGQGTLGCGGISGDCQAGLVSLNSLIAGGGSFGIGDKCVGPGGGIDILGIGIGFCAKFAPNCCGNTPVPSPIVRIVSACTATVTSTVTQATQTVFLIVDSAPKPPVTVTETTTAPAVTNSAPPGVKYK